MRTIAISNYKGGVGKVATSVNLAAIYAGRGRRTEAIAKAIGAERKPDKHLSTAPSHLAAFAKRPADSLGAGDLQKPKEIVKLASEMLESVTSASKAPSMGS